MNEELIRQCAREGARDYWMERHKETGSGSAKRLAEYSMEGVSDGGEDVGSAYIAIHLYHVRAVAPLVEAVTHMLEPSPPHVPVRDYGQRVASVKKALAPFQQDVDYCEGCGNGDKVPASGYWRCPKCDAEWPGEGGEVMEKQCCHCGTSERELRPYGPRAEWVCFSCAMKPENKATTEASFTAQISAVNGPGVVGEETGPRPFLREAVQ